jgi:hypothetical protein
MTVRKPPQKIQVYIVGERITVELGQRLLTRSDWLQPASSTGVSAAPVMTPSPAE